MPPYRSGGGKSKRSIGPILTKWLSVAACFALAEIYRLMGGDDEELLAEYCGRREVLDELGFDSAEVKHMKMLSGEGKAIVFEGRGDDGVVHKEIFYSFIYNRCFVSFAYSCAEENEAETDARMLKFLAESRDLRQEAFNNPD